MNRWMICALAAATAMSGVGARMTLAQEAAIEAVQAQPPAAPSASQEAAEAARNAATEARRAAEQLREEVRTARARVTRAAGGDRTLLFSRTGKKEKAAFLGISASRVTGALRANLDLQPGFGLVVDFVEEKSPAADAGVQQYDVLQKLNDQLLINEQQFQVLVRSFKPGEQVRLAVLRKGKVEELSATLIEKELPVLEEAGGGFGGWMGVNADAGDGNVVRLFGGPLPAVAPLAPLPPIEINAPAVIASGIGGEEGNLSIYRDSEMELRIERKEGAEKILTAKDDDENVLFEGPIETKEQREKLPANVAEKLEKFEKRLEAVTIPLGGTGGRVNIRILEK